MKYIISFLFFILFGLLAIGQVGSPSPYAPSGYSRLGFFQADSGIVYATRDTNWTPRNQGTMVRFNKVKYIWDGYWKSDEFSDGKIHLKNFGAGTNASINTAISFGKTVVVDTNLVISSNLITPQNSALEFVPGFRVTTTNSAQFVIGGQLISGKYQIFDSAANVKMRPYSATEIYPEWFGAIPMANPRDPNVAVGSSGDATNALKKAITFIQSTQYGTKVFGAIIRISGWYGLSDGLDVHGGYRFVGNTQEMEGSGLHWLGTGDSTKSMLKFREAEYGGVEYVAFRGKGSTSNATKLRAAIELAWDGTVQTQRRINLHHITIGDPIGYFSGDNPLGGVDFIHGIFCTGASGNNDFHTIDEINIANTDIGVRTQTDQSVEWRISNYAFNYGKVMYQSDLGGSITGDRWYAESITEGVIKVGGTINQELRVGLSNFSSEYMRGQYFINTSAKMKFSLTGENYISVNANYLDSTDGFALIKGSGLYFDGEYLFQNARIEFGGDGTAITAGYVNPTPRMYIEQLNSATSFKSIVFQNCTGAKNIYFKFPSVFNGNNSTYSNLTYLGEKNNETIANGNYYQQDKKFIINVKNSNIVQGVNAQWLYIKRLFDGSTETANNVLDIGEKGKSTTTGLTVKGYRSLTVASPVQIIPAILPAKSIIKGVTLSTTDANILSSAYYYLTVGTLKNERLFGTVSMPNAGTFNTLQSAVYNTADSAEPIVVKSFYQAPNNITYDLNGTVVTSNGTPFDTTMIGRTIKFVSGTIANQEFTITGYTNSQRIAVSNPNNYQTSTGNAIIQAIPASNKNLQLTVTYEELGKNKEQLDVNFTSSLPLIAAITKTPVLNEKQYVFNGVDTTGINKPAPPGYSLPIASSTVLGGIKIGADFAVDGTGVLSAPNFMHLNGNENIYGLKTFDQLAMSSPSASGTRFNMTNTNSAAYSFLRQVDDLGGEGGVYKFGSTYNYGAVTPRSSALYNSSGGDVELMADNATAKVKLAAGGNIAQVIITKDSVTSTVPISGIPATKPTQIITKYQADSASSLKLNITDTANIRLRPIAGTNTTITGTYPNLTFNATAGGGGSVTNVSGNAPLSFATGTTTPVGSIDTLNRAYGLKTIGRWIDDSTKIQGAIAAKQNTITLTTTGTGAATLVGSTLNIPTTATSGTYTPTLTNTTNITSSSINIVTWTKVGSVLHLNITGSITPTAATGATELTISLPFNSTNALSDIGFVNIGLNSGTSYTSGQVTLMSASTIKLRFITSVSTTSSFQLTADYNF